MLQRAKSFIVKNRTEIIDLELSETGHLRRNNIPIAAQPPNYECVGNEANKQIKQKKEKRGLRRQISLSLDNVMKNGLFNARRQQTTKKQEIEVQHNNASRLRMMNQAKKVAK